MHATVHHCGIQASLEGEILDKPALVEGFERQPSKQQAVSRLHDDSQEETSLIDQSSRQRLYAVNVREAIGLSGRLTVEDIADEARSATVIPRQIDLEEANQRTTSVVMSDVEKESRRKTTFPQISLSN